MNINNNNLTKIKSIFNKTSIKSKNQPLLNRIQGMKKFAKKKLSYKTNISTLIKNKL